MTSGGSGHGWIDLQAVRPGGTVSGGVAAAGGHAWLVTEAGLLRGDGTDWFPPPVNPSLFSVQAVAVGGETVLVGGEGGIAYSLDAGASWYRSASDGTFDSVTCLVTSPSWQRDGVALAGTNGTGIVRSTDGGRSWQTSSFGLEHLTILSLATAPSWMNREIVFAATVDGCYRSASGGRAWKSIDLGPSAGSAQGIAISPAFAEDGTVLVGTDSGEVFRSLDGGESWRPLTDGINALVGRPPINSLWFCADPRHPGVCLVATADGTIVRSDDAGATWVDVARVGAPVLCMFDADGAVYAGLDDEGFVVSADLGTTWTRGHVAARGLTRLDAGPDATLYASGPLAGIWQSTDGGDTWNGVESPEAAGVIHSFATAGDRSRLLAGTNRGLFVSEDAGETWLATEVSGRVHVIASASRFATSHRTYAGTHEGTVARSLDAGMSWSTLPSLTMSGPIVAIAELPSVDGRLLFTKVSFEPGEADLVVWRRTDSEDWEPWLRSSASRGEAHLAADPDHHVFVACLDRACWRFGDGGWSQVLAVDGPFLGIEHREGGVGFLAFTADRFYRSVDGSSWVTLFDGPPRAPLVDAAFSWEEVGGTVRALSTGGNVWQRDLPVITNDVMTPS